MDESVIEPDLSICDAHHHLWEALPGKHDRYMLEDLKGDLERGHRVETTIFVQCGSGYREEGPEEFRSVGEVEFVVKADPEGVIGGIVGFVDLRLRNLDDVLAAMVDAGVGRFKGVRQSSTWDADPIPNKGDNPPDLLYQASFRRGLAALGRLGLSYDAWVYHPQIPSLVDAARACPDVQIVLDHLGGPLGIESYADRYEEVMEVWMSGMRELATCANVALKVGGIGMPKFGQSWHENPERTRSDDIARMYGEKIRWCIELFGSERCMFESNFPVDRASFSYVVLWNGFKRIVEGASISEKSLLFSETARRIYRFS